MFADDAPKTDPWNEDRLGYRPFAERLANVIHTLRAPNGYVIGLHGEWGSGKSTALNFVRALLCARIKEEGNPIQVIEFRPWIVSGHQDLVGAFFKILAEAVTPEKLNRRRWWKTASTLARTAADPVADAADKLGVVIDPSAGLASGAFLNVGNATLKRLLDRWIAEPSLQQAYEELVRALNVSGQRFLVVIDDIDRLSGEEIRLIMQMVKTVGRLPHVVYLLAYGSVGCP